MGNRRQPIWVDSARTRTAADIVELGECDALIRRFARDISELTASGAAAPEAPRAQQQALHYRNLALRELKSRRAKLCSSNSN
ncbi:hypothetical protein AwMethylo_10290 [Methylobacterium sp.]|nr:hypothetical protein AwMethylo_10290 [Methylobacterium sp.]